MGYRRAEQADAKQADVMPVSQTKTNNAYAINEPHPVEIWGEEKPISEKKLPKYLTDDVFHYIDIYENICNFGLPYDNWLSAPSWLLDMYKMFKSLEKQYEHHLASKQYNN